MEIEFPAILAAQALFVIAALIFAAYSILAIYTLNNYGQSKGLTSSVSIIYSALAAGLLAWGFGFILTL